MLKRVVASVGIASLLLCSLKNFKCIALSLLIVLSTSKGINAQAVSDEQRYMAYDRNAQTVSEEQHYRVQDLLSEARMNIKTLEQLYYPTGNEQMLDRAISLRRVSSAVWRTCKVGGEKECKEAEKQFRDYMDNLYEYITSKGW